MASARWQVAKARELKVQPVFQTAWHAPAQLVPFEEQHYQAGEIAQLWWYSPAQLVLVEGQLCEVGEMPNSEGVSPLNSLFLRPSDVTRSVDKSVVTPYHSVVGTSLSQLSLYVQAGPPVAL